jgi:ubiquinol-cytochrome c reductase core subunit 2
MLSRTTRAAAGARRAYATVVDAGHGVRVAATDANAPTASVTLLVPAGTRHAPKAGAAQALKHFAFKVRALCERPGGR